MLDEIIQDITSRFKEDTLNAFMLHILLPENLLNIEDDKLKTTLSKLWTSYKPLLIESNGVCYSQDCFAAEVEMWKMKCGRENTNIEKKPSQTLQEVYTSCDRDIYPGCNTLIKILLSLPVSVSSSERSFSALRRLKTWLRNRISEQRMLGLALLHVHKEIDVNPERILDRFATSRKRKLEFLL